MTATNRLMTFGHLEIEFDGEVLRPRPWTEHQSAWSAALLADLPPGAVLELFAGVGHIGLLAVAKTPRHLVQVDADERACELARANSARARAANPCAGPRPAPSWSTEVRHGAVTEVLGPSEQFALVIADPPWVPTEETTDHPDDPASAIDGGDDGLDQVRDCLDVIGRHLSPGGAAVLQVGDRDQVDAVAQYVAGRPQLGLRVVEHRLFNDGALVHLARLTGDATG